MPRCPLRSRRQGIQGIDVQSDAEGHSGDRSVEIKLSDLDKWKDRTPVLVDDIISSGRTMLEAVRLLAAQGWAAPVCIAVHGLFANQADVLLAQTGARVVTSNSVPHLTNSITNSIDLTMLLADAIKQIA